MSDSTTPNSDPNVPEQAARDAPSVTETATGAPGGSGAGEPALPAEESTLGTGTSMALGCVAGTILLIIFGLIYLAITMFLR